MSKLNTKEETNVHEAKTLENFKYEPILRTKGLINRKLEFEKSPHRRQNFTL